MTALYLVRFRLAPGLWFARHVEAPSRKAAIRDVRALARARYPEMRPRLDEASKIARK